MTKADVLSGFKTIKICTSYKVNSEERSEIPFGNDTVFEPVYIEMQGWDEDITGIRDFETLPEALKKYIEFIENNTSVPVTFISVGPDREETIFRD